LRARGRAYFVSPLFSFFADFYLTIVGCSPGFSFSGFFFFPDAVGVLVPAGVFSFGFAFFFSVRTSLEQGVFSTFFPSLTMPGGHVTFFRPVADAAFVSVLLEPKYKYLSFALNFFLQSSESDKLSYLYPL